jgi:hypothetical protein
MIKVSACIAVWMAGMATGLASAEDQPAKTTQPPAKTTAVPAPAKKEPRGPLPAQFGKLGLSDDAKEELYLIDAEYDAQIQVLAHQIKQLQAARDEKMQAKLTPAQKTRLKELRDEADAKREAAAKLKAEAEAKDKKKPSSEKTPTPEKNP